MWEQLHRFRALNPAERAVFLRAMILLPLISFCLRLRGFGATQMSLQKLFSSVNTSSTSAEISQTVQQTARMVRAAGRYSIGRSTCLEESLAIWFLLGRQGIPCNMRIGTGKPAGRFEAHAWVECNGIALGEDAASHRHYAAFDAAFPPLPAARS